MFLCNREYTNYLSLVKFVHYTAIQKLLAILVQRPGSISLVLDHNGPLLTGPLGILKSHSQVQKQQGRPHTLPTVRGKLTLQTGAHEPLKAAKE